MLLIYQLWMLRIERSPFLMGYL